MPTYYVDPAAAGTNDGSSWTNAWTSIQTAADTAVAADIVYCRGSETTAATIDVDTNAGTNAAGWIYFIGCNASGNQDGTRFTINCNAGDYYGVTCSAMDLIWFENIRITGTGGTAKHGFYGQTSASQGWVFVNCSFDNNSGYGAADTSGYLQFGHFFRCTFYSNTQTGAHSTNNFYFCSMHDNTTDGYQGNGMLFNCLLYDNGDDGVSPSTNPVTKVINCVINHNADNGTEWTAGTTLYPAITMIGCRITNQSGAGDIGLNAMSDPVLTALCYFENNDGDNIQNAEVHKNLSIDGTTASSNIEDQSNTNQGYTDLTDGAEDFNLRSDASLRRTPITVPVI